jgi:hypothetical protein
LGTGRVFAYTSDPPPTPTPEKIVTCWKNVILKMPCIPSCGIHSQRLRSQLFFGKSAALNRLPFSRRRTL